MILNAQSQIIARAQLDGKLREYRKTASVRARPALPNERVVTTINGVEETVNRAGAGDIVVTGTAGEQYILSSAKFRERYEDTGIVVDDERVYRPTGTCWAVEYTGTPFTFNAPWGEPMIINGGDYMCTTAVGSEDIYRIERGVFQSTYALVK